MFFKLRVWLFLLNFSLTFNWLVGKKNKHGKKKKHHLGDVSINPKSDLEKKGIFFS
jgi:hypothetical protein